MKPAWDKLGAEYADSKTVVIGDVDCTVEKDLCSQYGVRGYPTIKYFTGATAADGDKYEGGRTFDALKTFVEENLGPSCGPDNIDLCDDAQKAYLETVAGMTADARAAEIKAKDAEFKAIETNFKDEVSKLQATYERLSKEKETAEADFNKANAHLRLLKAYDGAQKKAKKDEL